MTGFFPNQDTLPRGGFGNLITLLLQHGPRRIGNSVFVDSEVTPYSDQWAFLSELRRIPAAQDEDAFTDAPWAAPPSQRLPRPPIGGPIPDLVEIVLGDRVYVTRDSFPPGIVAALMRLAAFQNPEFYRAQAMRLSTFGKPRIIDCVEHGSKFVGFPRGCLEPVEELLGRYKIRTTIRDERNSGVPFRSASAAPFARNRRRRRESCCRTILVFRRQVPRSGRLSWPHV